MDLKLLLRSMKLTAIILLTACMTAGAKGYSQITLSEKNASLEKIFTEISRQSGYEFLYTTKMLQSAKTVDIKVTKATLQEVLAICFNDQPFSFTIIDKTVVVKPKTADNNQIIAEELQPPPIDIKGRVTNENGEPVDGASISVKGTDRGTTTDPDGYFELKAIDENASLVISGVNIETREIKISGKTNLTVVAKTAIKPLDAIVVNKGYYTTTQRLNTGNTSKVDSKTIEKQPVSNPLQALSGRMPGVVVTQETGVPGGGVQVQIRGRNSIANGNDPLYIVDGVPFRPNSLKSIYFGATLGAGSAFSTINPADIESIEVLKDADATAIYGSRGANGVVLITTKKGKAGKTKFDLNFSTAASKITRMMDLLNTQEYLQMRREAFKNQGAAMTTTNAYDLLLWDTTRYTDWQKQLLGGTGHTMNVQGSLSGGNANTQFLVSGGYYRESTVFPGDAHDQRGSGHLSLNHKSTDQKLNAQFGVSFQSENNQIFNGDFTNRALLGIPNAPEIYDQNGKLNWGNSPGNFQNPYVSLLNEYTIKTDNFQANTFLGYLLLPGLQLKANLGFTKMQTQDYNCTPIAATNPYTTGATGSAYFGNGSNSTWIIEPQADYQRKIGKGTLSILAGVTFQKSNRTSRAERATGYTNDLLLHNIKAAPTVTVSDQTNINYAYNAFFGRVNYNLNEKYIVNITGRRDGSSRFGPGKQFANFGAAGLAWIFSRESFIEKNFSFLSFGKLRASYGSSGNDQIGDYGYLDTYTAASTPYQGISALYPTRLANPDYSWEVNKKLEVALELGFIHDRILLSTSFYRNRSSNQLIGLPLSAVTGFSSVQANLSATTQNTGIEIEIKSVNIQRKNFSWSSAFNLSLPNNKLLEFPGIEKSAYANRYVVGKPLTMIKVYDYLGVDPTTGLYRFRDFNGDGVISDPSDRQVLLETRQIYYGGLLNSFQYKAWQLEFFFTFVKQMAQNYQASFILAGLIRNQPTIVLDRWQKPGDITNIQQFNMTTASPAYPAVDLSSNSQNGYGDASYIRLKNVYLSWQLPGKWKEKIKLDHGKLFIECQNLLTITNFMGLDPESKSFINLPPLRTIAAGFQLTF